MSETLRSEVVKSVSEAGDYEPQNPKQGYYSSGDGTEAINAYDTSTKVKHVGECNGNCNKDGTGTGTGSRSGRSFFSSLLNATLPSKLAIIVGLCQVGVGGAMVLTGILAIRYQSYFFHYGSGLWAGLLSSITGMLGAMCTKKGIPKPSWLCGGQKWQIHVFLLSLVFSLSTVILLAIFSISGLLQDARTIMAVEDYSTDVERLIESKNTAGILINTILLLLSILQILLCFSSLGLLVRVLFKPHSSLLSSNSGSEIIIRDGMEYHARKDHLISWLGHQRPNIVPFSLGGTLQKGGKRYPPPPQFVAIQPVLYPPPRRLVPYAMGPRALYPVPMGMSMPQSQMILGPSQFSFAPHPHPHPQHLVPIQTTTMMIPKSRRSVSATPVSSIASLTLAQEHQNRRQQKKRNQPNKIGSGVHVQKSFQTQSISSKTPSMISVKTERSEKNNEVEVTEVDVSRTYTGLDRSIADDYINTLNSRKTSTSISAISVQVDNENDEEGSDSELEITRM